jgi:MFS family permease
LNSTKRPKVFYGYWILLVAFLCLFIPTGCGYFIFSLFIRPLQADMGWSRAMIMMAFSILLLVTGGTSPLAGRLVDRYGPKRVICAGAPVMSLGFIMLSTTNSPWQFYLGYAIVGIGTAASSQVAASTMVLNWFNKKRGMAIGIMSTGIGAAGFVFAPLVGSYLIPGFGWRATYLVLAVITVASLLPAALLIVKTRPSDIGLYPDGIEPAGPSISGAILSSASSGIPPKAALATRVFWLLVISYLVGGFSSVGVIQSQVPHLEDIGFPAATAVMILSVHGMTSAIGKFAFGWFCDRLPAKYVCAIGLGLQAIGILLLLNMSTSTSPVLLWLYALLFGFSLGSWLPTMSILTGISFGLRSYGTIFGILSFFQCVGVSAGPLIAGHIFDITGSYHTAFVVFLLLYAVSIPTVLLVRQLKRIPT